MAPLLSYEDASKFVKNSCGKPVHRMSLRVDSPDPRTVVGELQARGDNVMMGYYKTRKQRPPPLLKMVG